MGKFLAILLVASAVLAGGGMYYLQVYHFYEDVAPSGERDVVLTSLATGQPEPILHDTFEAIDADSSPIRYRACFTTPATLPTLTVTYELAEDAVPLVAPKWFSCFDADDIGAALESGNALAFVGQQNIKYGIDRIVVITDDGRGYAWNQINRCGEVVFDGEPVPDDCPQPPEAE